MQKGKGRLLTYNAVFGQIFIIVFSVFSFAFLIGGAEFARGFDGGDDDTVYWYIWETDELGMGHGPIPEGAEEIEKSTYDEFLEQGPVAPHGHDGTEEDDHHDEEPVQKSGDKKISPLANPNKAPFELKAYETECTTNADCLSGNVCFLGSCKAPKGKENGNKSKLKTFSPFGALGLDLELVGIWGHLAEGVLWAGLALGAARLLEELGVDEKYTDPIGKALASGVGAGKLAWALFGDNAGVTEAGKGLFIKEGGFTGITQKTATFIGIGVAIVIFLLLYKDEEKKIVRFECFPYEPPLGGSDCERCNDDPFRPCSEYRCRSLGQACELVNKGSEEEKCVWVSPKDVTSPTITPWEKPLTEGHRYTSHDTRPPSLGTKIVKDGAEDGCIDPFTPLQFGILTNEPAQCKIDYVHTNKLDNMRFFFGETNYFLNNHTQQLSLPSPDSINSESPELENDGIYDLFVRCRDANGNENVDEFAFSFCVDPSPDTTPPIIIDTSIISGSPVAFNVSEVEITAFVNEPVECKWSIQNKDYEEMENEFVCSTSVVEQNAQQLYPCTTTLTGIKDREENKYYFRCKDQPSKPDNERNVNVQSYEFILRGTQPLNIIDSGPNGTITDNTEVVTLDLSVETSNGADEGVALCYFSDTGGEGSYVAMFDSDSFEHRQTLTLPPGDYTYFFRCVDAGGNSDEANTTFTIFVDTLAPMITRVYKELDALKIVTDEDAECAYSLNTCNFNFDEGIAFIYSNPSIRNSHFAPWEANNVYYIKCRDDFGNQPAPNECGLVASAVNII